MRCRAAPDWGSARLGTETTWRGARLVRVRRRRLEAARDEHRVDGLDEAVRALDVRRPVRRLRRALRLEADDRVVEPRLAREAAVEELAAEALLVARDRALRDLALDDVVLEDVSRERRAVVRLVLLERRVRRREERELCLLYTSDAADE